MNDAGVLSFRTVLGLICSIAVVVGVFGPWVVSGGASGETVLGVQRGIGQITLAGGVVAALAILVGLRDPARRSRISPALALVFGVLLVIGGLGWWDATQRDAFPPGVTRPTNGTFDMQAGWGVQLVTVAAALGLLLMIVEFIQLRRESGLMTDRPSAP